MPAGTAQVPTEVARVPAGLVKVADMTAGPAEVPGVPAGQAEAAGVPSQPAEVAGVPTEMAMVPVGSAEVAGVADVAGVPTEPVGLCLCLGARYGVWFTISGVWRIVTPKSSHSSG